MKVKKAKTSRNNPILAHVFAGLNDLVNWLESTPNDNGWESTHIGDSAKLDFKFCGAHTYNDVRNGLLIGKNVNEIKKAVSRGNGTRTTQKRGLDVIGGCPNVPASLMGSPANMYRIKTEKCRGAFNIFVDGAVHCGITKTQIRDAGIEILLKVLQLSAYYPVNLYVGGLGEYDGKIHCNATKIIDAGKPFNVARVSFALTEPAFLRVFGFGVIERNGGFWPKSARHGYGRPITSPRERRDAIGALFKNSIVISTAEVINRTTTAFNEIDDAINKKGR